MNEEVKALKSELALLNLNSVNELVPLKIV